jgi:hypothetical protein
VVRISSATPPSGESSTGRPIAPRPAPRRARGGHGQQAARRTHPSSGTWLRTDPWSTQADPVTPDRRAVPSSGQVRRHARSAASSGPRHVPRPREVAVSTVPALQLPATGALPPTGAEGATGGGATGAAGASAAALLVFVALYLTRALLPGLLALGVSRWQSALLVCRLERPG